MSNDGGKLLRVLQIEIYRYFCKSFFRKVGESGKVRDHIFLKEDGYISISLKLNS